MYRGPGLLMNYRKTIIDLAVQKLALDQASQKVTPAQ